jgi:hypothetical protein
MYAETGVFVTTSGEEMKKQLLSLRARGSGDSPEKALQGLVNGEMDFSGFVNKS